MAKLAIASNKGNKQIFTLNDSIFGIRLEINFVSNSLKLRVEHMEESIRLSSGCGFISG